jgi:hypothetical protein
MDVNDERYPNGRNSFGIPLYNQVGHHGISNFDVLVAALSPTLRAIFEEERTILRQAGNTSKAHEDSGVSPS